MSDAPEYKFVTYETLDDGTIARIMLDRADAKNAQNRGMLVELDEAFLRAEADGYRKAWGEALDRLKALLEA